MSHTPAGIGLEQNAFGIEIHHFRTNGETHFSNVIEPSLPAALDVVRRLPDVRFVIDHLGKPRIASGATDPEWERAMAPFSDSANVFCKLSGMVTEASWPDWKPEDLVPYVRRAIGWFGGKRCMFGSDWPVCLLAASYQQVIETMRNAISDLNSSEQAEVFGGNAVRVYRLPE